MRSLSVILIIGFHVFAAKAQTHVGETTISEWQYGKNGAVSLTYDDGSYNQFRYALPIMERLQMPATFFVITGGIPGSKYQGKFIGRPVKDIISETATVPTTDANFFERCSAGGYLGYQGTISYITRAAGLYDEKHKDKAYQLIDELYGKVRNGDFPAGYQPCDEVLQEKGSTWDDFRHYGKEGYEIASHSITHASMPALDSVNISYELQKSKQEIRRQMGERYTFSSEVPYGYEDGRVMQIAYKIYPALRNRMPEPWLKEIDRASKKTPGTTDKDYIQWQRGATTKTPLTLMKSWVDTAVAKNNTWLVLVFHGVDGMGYEALPHTLLDDYFQYIKSFDDKLWIATFGDVAKYMRERENAKVQSKAESGKITVTIIQPLDKKMYDLPVTLKTYVPAGWKKASIVQASRTQTVEAQNDDNGSYLLYQGYPNGGKITVKGS